MHELALAEGILAIALEAGDGQKVKAIHIQLGQLQHVTQENLQFSFELIAEGTTASEATIITEEIPAKFRCKSCGGEGSVWQPLFQCLSCNSRDLEILSGEEILVQSIELFTGEVIRNQAASLGEVLEEHLKEHHGSHADSSQN